MGAETGKRMHSEMGFIRVPKEQLGGRQIFALAVTQSSGTSFVIISIAISNNPNEYTVSVTALLFVLKIIYSYVIEFAGFESDIGFHGRVLILEIFVFGHFLVYFSSGYFLHSYSKQ